MHDCRTIERKLIDLIFDEVNANEKLRLLAEMETCDSCLTEYRSMASALVVFDEAVEASLPAEAYWAEHHAGLRQRIDRVASYAAPRRAPFWKRIMVARLPIPAPAAAVIVIALLISSALALRPRGGATTTAQPSIVTALPPQVVEVPVYREKIITRTVYVEKKPRGKNEPRPQTPIIQRKEATLTARHDEEEGGQGGFFTRANLRDFQPADEMRIRIIKRSDSDEN